MTVFEHRLSTAIVVDVDHHHGGGNSLVLHLCLDLSLEIVPVIDRSGEFVLLDGHNKQHHLFKKGELFQWIELLPFGSRKTKFRIVRPLTAAKTVTIGASRRRLQSLETGFT